MVTTTTIIIALEQQLSNLYELKSKSAGVEEYDMAETKIKEAIMWLKRD